MAVAVFGFLFYFGSTQAAGAATLYLSPSAGTFSVGQTFSVSVYTSSSDQAMNAASATISFSSDRLEVSSVSKNGTIMSLWPVEPNFSNGSGAINFEGIILNPGYTGATGKLLTVNFKAKAEGEARVAISAGSVLANDGYGTNIVTGLGSATYTLIAEGVPPPAPPAAVGMPAAPTVTSSTHPDQNAWYANNDSEFSWGLPAGVTGVNVFGDQEPYTNPGTRSDGVFSSYSYDDVEDGVWYFHIRLLNAKGWGGITHFKFQIDTAPPSSPVVTLIDGEETDNPRPRVSVVSEDATSGIAFYRLTVDAGAPIEVKPEEISSENPYVLPPLEPGPRRLTVEAVDQAGNASAAVKEFKVNPIATPLITDYPSEMFVGDSLIIKGETYPNSLVIVELTTEAGKTSEQSVQSDEAGLFTLVWPERLKAGLYTFQARVTDYRWAWSEWTDPLTVDVSAWAVLRLGRLLISYLVVWPERLKAGLYTFQARVTDYRVARSEWTDPLTVDVSERAVLRLGGLLISYLSIFLTLIAPILLLLLLIFYIRYRFLLYRKKLRKEVSEVSTALHEAFDRLRADVRKQIKLIERTRSKRELTQEEEKIISGLKRDLNEAERKIRKEVQDVKKDVEK